MRKFLAITLALVMIFTLAFGLTACGDKEENAGLANPMTEFESLDEINGIVGCLLCHPGVMGVTDEKFFTVDCADFTIAEYQFTLNGTPFVFRSAPVSEDISGIYDGEGTVFQDTAEEGIVDLDGETFVARWFTLDGQYCLSVSDTANATIDGFEAIAEELKALTMAPYSQDDLYAALPGEYQDSMSGRAMMSVTDAGDCLNVTVEWSDSAAAFVRWTMTANLGQEGLLYYDDCQKFYVTMVENADGTYSEDVVEQEVDASGYFSPSDEDGIQKLYWNGASETGCQECVFEKLEFVTPQ